MNYLENLGKTYANNQGVATLNGQKGPYNNVNNESVKYGRNAATNYQNYIESFNIRPLPADTLDFANVEKMSQEEFDKKLKTMDEDSSASTIPVKFNYKYLPEEKVDPKNINKMALLGAAFEELGKKISVSTAELTEKMQKAFGEKMSAEALDINKDQQIDAGEYASSILLADMLSTDAQNVDAKNIKGEINNSGQNNSLAYANKKNLAPASEMFKSIYNTFGLEQAHKEFADEKNNLV